MVNALRFALALGTLVLMLSGSGCSLVSFGAVNPMPPAVPEVAKTFSLELGQAVPNDQVLDTIAIRQFHATLRNGFHNAAGDRYVASPEAGSCRLMIDKATLRTENLGNVGKFLSITYRARWLDDHGATIVELVGMAQPRERTETRPRHLEDVVEVMYEQLIDALASSTVPAGKERQVAKATP